MLHFKDSNTDYMRLDKYICESTGLSRADAKKALHRGGVTCNGEIVKKSGLKVGDDCEIYLDGKLLTVRGFRYIMLNKPVDYLCSTVDEIYPSVLRLINVEKVSNLRIAGRLDVDTTGLVLITDNGHWSHKITSPGKDCPKRYRVQLAEPVDKSLAETFAKGIQLRNEKGLTRPATLEIVSASEVLLTIAEGKYHQVKRMFAAVGNHVVALHRESVGEIVLDKSLEPGQWRYLTDEEIASVQ